MHKHKNIMIIICDHIKNFNIFFDFSCYIAIITVLGLLNSLSFSFLLLLLATDIKNRGVILSREQLALY